MWGAALGVRLSRLPIPSRRLRERIYRLVYGQKYRGLNETELDRPLADFRSLNELFTRGVRPECRPIDSDENQWLCPCDSTVQDVGQLLEQTLLTVKGIEYSLESLLPGEDVRPFHNGNFAIFFLSPADCHRVFAPAAGEIYQVRHVPGRRLLVHPPYQRAEYPVFTLNERVIVRMRTPHGECAVVLVAGWGVGHITHPFSIPLQRSSRKVTGCELSPPLSVSSGDWIATFELGSTVLLITEPQAGLKPVISRDTSVHYGEPAFHFQGLDGVDQ
ncbi:MAG: phosphatidylserine decarboxylase [Planctomycetes bacterium]|nr:phosphatidylserine decarboxylase [Planctomycetota bacterium]